MPPSQATFSTDQHNKSWPSGSPRAAAAPGSAACGRWVLQVPGRAQSSGLARKPGRAQGSSLTRISSASITTSPGRVGAQERGVSVCVWGGPSRRRAGETWLGSGRRRQLASNASSRRRPPRSESPWVRPAPLSCPHPARTATPGVLPQNTLKHDTTRSPSAAPRTRFVAEDLVEVREEGRVLLPGRRQAHELGQDHGCGGCVTRGGGADGGAAGRRGEGLGRWEGLCSMIQRRRAAAGRRQDGGTAVHTAEALLVLRRTTPPAFARAHPTRGC